MPRSVITHPVVTEKKKKKTLKVHSSSEDIMFIYSKETDAKGKEGSKKMKTVRREGGKKTV